VYQDESTSRLTQAGSLARLTRDERARRYLGWLAPQAERSGREQGLVTA